MGDRRHGAGTAAASMDHLLLLLLLLMAGTLTSATVRIDDALISPREADAMIEQCIMRKVRQYCEPMQYQADRRQPATLAEDDLTQEVAVTTAAPIAPITLPQETTTKIPDRPVRQSLSTIQDKLHKEILRNYEKTSIAQRRSGGPVQVSVAFTLIQLNNLDERSQVLTTSGWMEVTWKDERLLWDVSEYSSIDHVVLRSDMIWLPDIALQNSATDIYHSSLVDHKFRTIISYDGSILWIPGGKYSTNCEIDISFFPFDDQTCKLHFTNWAFNGAEMNLTVTYPNISLDNYRVNGEWEMVMTTATRQDKYYACCGDTPYPSIYFTMYLRRKYLFYITNILAPCIMLSFLVTLVFLLPPDEGEKIGLGVTVLLSFTVFLLLIAESIPKNSDTVPIISIYLATFLAITTCSVFSTVLVLSVHHSGDETRVPRLIRRLIFDGLARLVCMHSIVQKYGRNATSGGTGNDFGDEHFMGATEYLDALPLLLQRRNAIGKLKPEHKRNTTSGGNGRSPRNRQHSGFGAPVKKSASITDDKLAFLLRPMRNAILEEILEHIKAMVKERKNSEHADATRQEWIAVAKVIDRCLLITYFVFIATSSIVILTILPLFKPPFVIS